MAIITKPILESLNQLLDLRLLQIAVKRFHYNDTASFPYNLLIAIIDADKGHGDHFIDRTNDTRVDLAPMHFYLLPCHTPISFQRTPQVTGITIRFNLDFYHGFDIFDDSGGIVARHAPALVRRIESLVCKDSNDPLRTSFDLKAAIMDCCLSCWPDSPRSVTPTMWKYERALRYVREHCTAELSVSDLADIHGVRQDVFSRAFRRDLGTSPRQYIADQLTRIITRLLLTTDYPLNDIAERLAFSSPYYFSRFFKKQVGLPPSEYRAALLAGELP